MEMSRHPGLCSWPPINMISMFPDTEHSCFYIDAFDRTRLFTELFSSSTLLWDAISQSHPPGG
jgi:hypothetical protein